MSKPNEAEVSQLQPSHGDILETGVWAYIRYLTNQCGCHVVVDHAARQVWVNSAPYSFDALNKEARNREAVLRRGRHARPTQTVERTLTMDSNIEGHILEMVDSLIRYHTDRARWVSQARAVVGYHERAVACLRVLRCLAQPAAPDPDGLSQNPKTSQD